MRRSLVAAVALAPLCLAAGAASAQTTTVPVDTVTSSSSTPIATATAVNSAPGDIDINSGAINVSTAATTPTYGVTPAVTLNSDNNVTNAGSVTISNLNNSAAILAIGGSTGSNTQNITNSGTITNTDSFSASTNGDGFTEEPYATPTSTSRYGILVTGSGPLLGQVYNSGTITVSGDSSYGIAIAAPLIPTAGVVGLVQSGTISLTGDGGAASTPSGPGTGGGVGLYSSAAGTINGGVLITGAISTLGQNTSAINLQGDVDGRLSVYSAIVSTAYASTTRPATSSSLQSVQETSTQTSNGVSNTQVGQSSGAMIVGGNVTQGIFIGAPPVTTNTSTATTVDLDGDGIADVGELSGSVTNYGSAAALTVGGAGPTTIGLFVGGADTETTSNNQPFPLYANNNYGIIIRGAVQGIGVYDGVSATGLQIGGEGGTTTVQGGVRVVGSITADSYEAPATAINLGAGANVPTLDNENYIEASISHSALVTTSTSNATVTDVLINPGATLNTLVNYGTIQASANGDHMSAVGVMDASGTVTNVLNEGVISASVLPVTAGLVATTGVTQALNLAADNQNITLTQEANPNPFAIDVTTTTSSTGVVSTTSALNTVTATTTTIATTPTTPEIIGDVLLGSGTNTVSILGGSVTGALSLGGGANDVLTIGDANNAADTGLYTGALTNVVTNANGTTGAAGTGLQLSVVNGVLANTATGTLNLSSLTIGNVAGVGTGVLYAAIDPVNGAQTLYNATGAATIYANGQLGIVLKTPLFSTQTYTVIQATGGLTSGVTNANLLTTDVPYLITGTATQTANAVNVTLTPKTAAQLQLNPAESAALNPVLNALGNDAQIEGAVLGAYTRPTFLKAYDQLLPDYSGGVFQLALAASDSVTRATSRVNDIQNPSGTRGAWAEEVAFGVNKNADSQSAGYQGGGFGFVGGLETGGLGLGAFGLTGSFLTGDVKDPHSPGDNLSSFSEGEGGAYWQGQLGGFRGDARVGAGYLLYSERREFVLTDAAGDTTVDKSAHGNSSGYTLTGHFGLGYQTPQFGLFYFRPQVHGDYFRLEQGGYTERYGGPGLDLTLAQRTGDEASGTVSLVTGMSFGSGFQWRPELELGYRDVFTGTAGNTVAQFGGDGQFAPGAQFTLPPAAIRGGGPVGRLDVKADTDFYELNFEAGAEQRLGLVSADLRISVRVLF
jgi:hypothetical protein